jgi:hypothetical protein
MLSKKPVETTLYSLSDAPPAQPDRRSEDRYVSLLRVGALLVSGRRELCLIRNISAGGMMIRAYSPLEPGTAVSIELKQGDPVSGIAQWADGDLVGITFDAPIDVVALLSAASTGPRPRMPRIELDCTVSLREGADVHRGKAVNISQGGVRVEAEAELRLGAHVIVSINGLPPAAGVVKWKDGTSYGIGFNRVFPVCELMGFIQGQQQELSRLAS